MSLNNKLPYDFDLFFDIKQINELIEKTESNDIDGDEDDLFDLVELHNIVLPDNIKRNKDSFPKVVWIDDNGGYITYAPTKEEEHKYRRMYNKRFWR